MADFATIYQNCADYNGDESEYTELSLETKKTFDALCLRHFRGEEPEEEEEGGPGRKGRSSRSPSACQTPELTSESSEEEEEGESDGR